MELNENVKLMGELRARPPRTAPDSIPAKYKLAPGRLSIRFSLWSASALPDQG